ncbi:MAG: glycoside hydrolase family 92 protein [Bacteroidetes bacterium]|nr:glycoside hydrolase family 92 protein [Bacteroidota bacterium]
MNRLVLLLTGAFLFSDVILVTAQPDLFFGTRGTGNQFPGATVPHGMISLSPHTNSSHPVGYLAGDSVIHGFGTVHLSGASWPVFGGVTVMPGVDGRFSAVKKNERAVPGFYQVELQETGITASMAASVRSGLFHFRWNQSQAGKRQIRIGLNDQLGGPQSGFTEIINSSEMVGYQAGRSYGPSAVPYTIYYVLRFSEPAASIEIKTRYNSQFPVSPTLFLKDSLTVADLSFGNQADSVLVQVGVSFVSIANARLNLESELRGFDFGSIQRVAASLWQEALGRVSVAGGSDHFRTLFSTALYHSLLLPMTFSDVNGEYPRPGGAGVNQTTGTQLTALFLDYGWRTHYPLLSFLYPETMLQVQSSILNIAESQAWLPMTELAGRETFQAEGDPATMVLADSWFRGMVPANPVRAMSWMVKSASDTLRRNPIRPGLEDYIRLGYMPADADQPDASVIQTLDYARSDFMLARLADTLDMPNVRKDMRRRAALPFSLWDPVQNRFLPRNDQRGVVQTTADPRFWLFRYDWSRQTLTDSLGGMKDLLKVLVSMIRKNQISLSDPVQAEWPLFFMQEKAEVWRAHQVYRDYLLKTYSAGVNDYAASNEGAAESSRLVWLMMGLYPEQTGRTGYFLIPPAFETVTVQRGGRLKDQRSIIIVAEKQRPANYFIKEVSWRGKPEEDYFIPHHSLIRGGELKLEMNPRIVQVLMD